MQNRLLEAIQQDRTPHAILISGPEGSGRRELARRCAALFCLGEDAPERLINCPNYYEIGESAVKVDDIRTLLSSAAMQGFNGGQRAFVFVNAQLMSTQIQNTLLKTLEEPHSETMLILTGNEFGVLPTIRSRCVIERLGAGSVTETAQTLTQEGMPPQEAHFYATLADGILSRARAYATEEARTFRMEALAILDRAVFEYAPFSDAADLVTIMSAEPEPDDIPDDEPKTKGKKRKKGDVQLALNFLTICISVFQDALNEQLAGQPPRNADQRLLIQKIASHFTTARIQGIIEMLSSSQQKLTAGGSVYLTLDSALAKLFADA
jgi:replication-associated recombination protein RarA